MISNTVVLFEIKLKISEIFILIKVSENLLHSDYKIQNSSTINSKKTSKCR